MVTLDINLRKRPVFARAKQFFGVPNEEIAVLKRDGYFGVRSTNGPRVPICHPEYFSLTQSSFLVLREARDCQSVDHHAATTVTSYFFRTTSVVELGFPVVSLLLALSTQTGGFAWTSTVDLGLYPSEWTPKIAIFSGEAPRILQDQCLEFAHTHDRSRSRRRNQIPCTPINAPAPMLGLGLGIGFPQGNSRGGTGEGEAERSQERKGELLLSPESIAQRSGSLLPVS
ncbi:hypothetical protein DFH07DRAFT_785657 [Mycena maculata]|uniref:Uncharacterized protein n=1 Tax=Mycena maculata TaxID=230809 RepID=A0AAD7H9F0_9AGAR|nr:hypothetical protein DFH07DRAFT_785657 [Mycena maculata]